MTLSFSISHRFSLHGPGSMSGRVVLLCRHSTNRPSGSPPSSSVPSPPHPPPASHNDTSQALMKERLLAAVRYAAELGQHWAQRSTHTASATMNYWWEKYEEFVGINEVREAQTRVTEAEAAFMVARGLVRESHTALEALQSRLKEVRARLDRVSREEAQYLELATMEHKLLQEERRHRSDYEKTEICEREKFSLFSAAVRASHEKERTRAERTKNWSIIGSVLGAVIGVMGSTYINHVRLQELKNLLLDAQSGPQSLQEALKIQAGIHQSQQDQLQTVIQSLKDTVTNPIPATVEGASSNEGPGVLSSLKELHICNQKTRSILDSLIPQVGKLGQGLDKLERRLDLLALPGVREAPQEYWTVGEPQKRLSSVFSFTAVSAVTVATLYLMFRAATG